MQKDVLVETHYGRTRVAVLEDGVLKELYSEQLGNAKLSGNIYIGRCQNVLPGMQAAFIDIGLEKNAFLYAGDMTPGPECEFPDGDHRIEAIPIQKMVRPGQELIVQVIKEPGGNKGVRVSTHITLPGRTVVLLPTVEYIGVSRKLDEETREALRTRIRALKPDGMGVIVRTVGAEATDEELAAEIESLSAKWRELYEHARHLKAPRLISQDETLLVRAVRESISSESTVIRIEGEADYNSALDAVMNKCPQYAGRLLRHESKMPLFSLYRVDEQARKALNRRVWLKSGAYLVIDHTEAMTVIDVNSGKYIGGNAFSETVKRVNMEAVAEIATQIRLRDVGGIIIVDFIDMRSESDKNDIVDAMREALKSDRAKTSVLDLTKLGLLEMTRKKPQHTLFEQYACHCGACGGEGTLMKPESLARRALDDIAERRAMTDAKAFVIKAAPRVYSELIKLAQKYEIDVEIKSDPEADDYSIELDPLAAQ